MGELHINHYIPPGINRWVPFYTLFPLWAGNFPCLPVDCELTYVLATGDLSLPTDIRAHWINHLYPVFLAAGS